jgi:hypothetical protein
MWEDDPQGGFSSSAVRDLVAERARSLWKGASAKHLLELLLAEEGCSVSSKTIARILKEAGLKSPLSHKGARKGRRRARMERFGQMLQIDASPFDWLSKGSMISLHGAIDNGTVTFSLSLDRADPDRHSVRFQNSVHEKHRVLLPKITPSGKNPSLPQQRPPFRSAPTKSRPSFFEQFFCLKRGVGLHTYIRRWVQWQTISAQWNSKGLYWKRTGRTKRRIPSASFWERPFSWPPQPSVRAF